MCKIEKQLIDKLKEYIFDNEDYDISGVMCLLDTESDMKKMYDYIIDNNITDINDIYKYGFKLADDFEEIIGIED